MSAGTVTLLFTDIEGSTRLLHQLGDDYAVLLSDHRRILRTAFQAHGGREVDTQGDSFFVVFEEAQAAVAAAADSQSALDSHRWLLLALRRSADGHADEPALLGPWRDTAAIAAARATAVVSVAFSLGYAFDQPALGSAVGALLAAAATAHAVSRATRRRG